MSKIRDIVILPKTYEVPKQLIVNNTDYKYILVQYPIVIENVCLYIFKKKLYYDKKRSTATLGEQMAAAQQYTPDLRNFRIKTKNKEYRWDGNKFIVKDKTTQ